MYRHDKIQCMPSERPGQDHTRHSGQTPCFTNPSQWNKHTTLLLLLILMAIWKKSSITVQNVTGN